MVKVRLHGILKEEARVGVIDVEGECLDEVFSKLPSNVKEVLTRYSKYLIVLVNGKRVYDLESVLTLPNDHIDITIPVGGG